MSAMRVVAVMNLYTDDCPESTRRLELSRHRYGRASRAAVQKARASGAVADVPLMVALPRTASPS